MVGFIRFEKNFNMVDHIIKFNLAGFLFFLGNFQISFSPYIKTTLNKKNKEMFPIYFYILKNKKK